jgi:hypothetical protein
MRKSLLAALAVVVVAAIAAVAFVLAKRGGSTPQAHQSGLGTQTSPVSSTGPIPVLTKDTPSVIQAIDHPTATLLTGFTTRSFPPSQIGTKSGFSIAVPLGWQVRQPSGTPWQVFFRAPDGVSFVEVDLSSQGTRDMVAALASIRRQALAQNRFPGYQLIDFTAQDVRGTRGALWRFDWVNSSQVKIRVDDLLFTLQTTNGPQAYAIYMMTPEGTGPGMWNGSNGLLATIIDPMLESFQPSI